MRDGIVPADGAADSGPCRTSLNANKHTGTQNAHTKSHIRARAGTHDPTRTRTPTHVTEGVAVAAKVFSETLTSGACGAVGFMYRKNGLPAALARSRNVRAAAVTHSCVHACMRACVRARAYVGACNMLCVRVYALREYTRASPSAWACACGPCCGQSRTPSDWPCQSCLQSQM